MDSGFGGTKGNLDMCRSAGSLGSISNLANRAYGCGRVSGILLAISTADLSSISFEVLFVMMTIVFA